MNMKRILISCAYTLMVFLLALGTAALVVVYPVIFFIGALIVFVVGVFMVIYSAMENNK